MFELPVVVPLNVLAAVAAASAREEAEEAGRAAVASFEAEPEPSIEADLFGEAETGPTPAPAAGPIEEPTVCVNGCGRTRAEGYPTCCRTCSLSNGQRHGPQCEARHSSGQGSQMSEVPS